MTIRFDIDIEDILAFQRKVWDGNKALRRRDIFLKWTFPTIFIGFNLFVFLMGRLDYNFILLSLPFILIWPMYVSYVQRKGRIKKARKVYMKPENQSFLGERELSFDPSDIVVKEKNTSATINWEEIRKFEETPDHFFLFNTGLSALIIPKRKIMTDEVTQLQLLFKEHALKLIEAK